MEDIGLYLDITRFLVGVIILAYASYTDIKTRRASNLLWFIIGSVGAFLLIIQYFTTGIDNIVYLAFIPIMILLMFVFFQLRLIFGGADAKAIMALAILVPLEPAIFNYPLWSSIMPFSWVIFSNSIILFLFIPISLLIFNMAKRNVEFPHVFLGYKMDIKKARQKFVWPLEKIKDGKRRFSYMPKEFDAEKEFNEFEKLGYRHIWVTPKIPFMIPLLAGFICAFILGDILYTLMNSII
jgi:preflagellin peptidase FlaK